MKFIDIKLKNCYGIKELAHKFKFHDGDENRGSRSAYLIYAPNGAMKSSLARVFSDIQKGVKVTERIYSLEPSYDISNENGAIGKDAVYVVDVNVGDSDVEKISDVLVKPDLKKKYDRVYGEIEAAKKGLLTAVRKRVGIKGSLEEEYAEIFGIKKEEFLVHLVAQKPKVFGTQYSWTGAKYSIFSSNRVSDFLSNSENRNSLDSYVETLNNLFSNSRFFKNGFTHNGAESICKSLKEAAFFEARHKVLLDSVHGELSVSSEKELTEKFNKEREAILGNADLAKKFDRIDDALKGHNDLKAFRQAIHNDPTIIPELVDLAEFRRKLWISYFQENKELYAALIQIYEDKRDEVNDIVIEAQSELEAWREIVGLFNNRFFVPFKIKVKNQEDVILSKQVPTVVFEYDDGRGKREVERSKILESLSVGEKRALFLLEMIFEIESRRKKKECTILLFDDVADSFDYKNKYAIVQYLSEIMKEEKFRALILTHNFDFYRTMVARHVVHRENCLMTQKGDTRIDLVPPKYVNDPFVSLKKELIASKGENKKALITLIPFVRNLISYGVGDIDSSKLLTSLLHVKKGSSDIKMSEIKPIFKAVLGVELSAISDEAAVCDLILNEASKIDDEGANLDLEEKVVLSIACRILAERYMIKMLKHDGDVDYKENQTGNLAQKFKENFKDRVDEVDAIDQVSLMTAENIHLNSFMFEPILDLSSKHLVRLFKKVRDLAA